MKPTCKTVKDQNLKPVGRTDDNPPFEVFEIDGVHYAKVEQTGPDRVCFLRKVDNFIRNN